MKALRKDIDELRVAQTSKNRLLQESVAAVKRQDEDVKALKKVIDELRGDQTSKKVGGG